MRITQDSFRKNVKDHEMKVLLNQGVYRHLRFQAPKTSNQYFEIVTFPGTLVYVGDMGSFIFQRITDMFEFFRTRSKTNLEINPSYWGEKLEAVDNRQTYPGYKVYSEEKLRNHVQEIVTEWCAEEGLTEEQVTELNLEIKAQVLYYLDQGEEAARRAVNDFSYEIDGQKFEFHDSWEWDCREYSNWFIWCCYALVWAINRYDETN